PYIAFANPLLTGRNGADRRAFERTGCAPTAIQTADVEEQPPFAELFRGATADADSVRALQPLPETTDEVCAIAAALGADADALHLGAAATETSVKQLSADGTLARTSVLHFATHGLVSGELAGLAEPAIVLTPSDSPTVNDDGLLTASEVTTLKLDADWVILSACNTASSDGGGEALSGLARAFFYAGARALMVSHWPVNSDAAVRLASGAVSALAAEPDISRAEALRRAMVAEIDRGGDAADPANWAPFILVGAGR
ncbi:MAG: CHAT domain-containing protein, partial [Devosia sp.]